MPCQFVVAAWHVAIKPLHAACQYGHTKWFCFFVSGSTRIPRGGCSIPEEHAKGSPLVRLDDLPHESLELEDRVRNVENCQQP